MRRVFGNFMEMVFWVCVIVLAMALYDYLKMGLHPVPSFRTYSI